MTFIDADICVDMLRGLPAAKEWFRTVAERPCVPGFVAIELVAGCRDGRELQSIRKFLKPLQIVWASEDDMNRALTDYAPFFLSHGLGGFDALIAATATGQGATLYTFNEKHFRTLPGLMFEAPYTRI